MGYRIQDLMATGTISEANAILEISDPTQTPTSRRATLAQLLGNVYTAITTAISSEATTRANADTALGTAITTAISGEATARANADTALGTSISNEATARANTDTILQTYLSSIVPQGSAVTGFVSTVPGNVTSLVLPAGTWQLWGEVYGQFAPSGAAFAAQLAGSISRSSGFLDYNNAHPSSLWGPSTTSAVDVGGGAPGIIISTTGSTVYLVAAGVFANGTLKCCGSLYARRIL
jgi:hypothetical protein